jgi:hypothetical protein
MITRPLITGLTIAAFGGFLFVLLFPAFAQARTRGKPTPKKQLLLDIAREQRRFAAEHLSRLMIHGSVAQVQAFWKTRSVGGYLGWESQDLKNYGRYLLGKGKRLEALDCFDRLMDPKEASMGDLRGDHEVFALWYEAANEAATFKSLH